MGKLPGSRHFHLLRDHLSQHLSASSAGALGKQGIGMSVGQWGLIVTPLRRTGIAVDISTVAERRSGGDFTKLAYSQSRNVTSFASACWTTRTVISSIACCCEQRRDIASDASEKPSPFKDGEKRETISVTFVNKGGERQSISVPVGMNMLEAAHNNDIELEGACEGSLACSTCHVIVMDEDYYARLPEPTDEENDMLDLAFGLTETSRLGCQVIAAPELEGLQLALPAATRNFAVDGHVPKPH